MKHHGFIEFLLYYKWDFQFQENADTVLPNYACCGIILWAYNQQREEISDSSFREEKYGDLISFLYRIYYSNAYVKINLCLLSILGEFNHNNLNYCD